MKIIFMGTPDFTIPILDSLFDAGHDIAMVVSQPDRPKGRKQILSSPPAVEWAREHGIEVFQPERVREEEAVERLEQVGADIFVVAAFGQILPKVILDMPRFGCVNVHASLLPKYRGAAPIQWAILDGQKVTGVTIMQMQEGLDDGDILLQKEITIGEEDTGGSLFDKLAILGGEAIVEALPMIEKGQITPVKQDESKATKVGKIDKSLGRLDMNNSAEKLVRFIHGLSPWPGCVVSFRGKDLKIQDAKALSEDELAGAGFGDVKSDEFAAGETVLAKDDKWIVKTGEGLLGLTRVQMSGKKAMGVEDFMRGHHVDIGEKLS